MSIRTFLGKSFIKNEKRFVGKDKKGQLEIGITSMVIIAFIVLLLFSLVLYFRFTYSDIQNTKESLLDQKYSSLLSTIIGLPEFRCSKSGVEDECLDASKLSGFSSMIQTNEEMKEYYDNLFLNVDGIWVDVIDSGGLGSNDYSSNSKLFIYGEKDSLGLIYSVPVSLYYPDYKRYKIGILRIQGDVR